MRKRFSALMLACVMMMIPPLAEKGNSYAASSTSSKKTTSSKTTPSKSTSSKSTSSSTKKTTSTSKTTTSSKSTSSLSKKSTSSSSKSSSSKKTSSKSKSSSSDKYAAIVVDAVSGRILYEKSAHAIRYPASLTKMMTLYLAFEALQKGQITLDQSFSVSSKAASMPQTNINLKTGDRLSVRDAIGSLVVRSANDAAVVLAEGLAKTTWNFGVQMTQKAHGLGMKNTVFRNPNGLPDSQQYTTAYDMAILGIALRRDFPEFYAAFKMEDFYYDGRSYSTHNNLLGRYSGADGIKTGYINASGFNLVTSVRRPGGSLVAVVMGGRTSKTRDTEMMRLLDNAYVQIAQKKMESAARIEMAAAESPADKPSDSISAEEGPLVALEEAVEKEEKPVPIMETPRIIAGVRWGIQVGSFSSEEQAYDAAEQAVIVAQQDLEGARITVSDQRAAGTFLHRVRIEELSEDQARNACQKLSVKEQACLVYRMEAGQGS